MYRYDRTKFVESVVNFTRRPVSFYEESTGKIVTFCPQEACLPPGPQPDMGSLARRLYVVEPEDLTAFVACGYSAEDMAVIKRRGLGRHGREVCYLAWGADCQISVCLRNLGECRMD